MEFDALLELVGDDPIFESSVLLSGNVDPQYVRLQLTRWVNSGRIFQLRRGLYSIAPPYRKETPHPFLVANHLKRASYVSLQSALSFYGLIPEVVTITTSVTGGRPCRFETPLGAYDFRHMKTDFLFGYQMIDLGGQSALVAAPEKALLDLIYLQPGGESLNFLQELRLQDGERLDLSLLMKQSEMFHSPKMRRAKQGILRLIHGEASEYEEL